MLDYLKAIFSHIQYIIGYSISQHILLGYTKNAVNWIITLSAEYKLKMMIKYIKTLIILFLIVTATFVTEDRVLASSIKRVIHQVNQHSTLDVSRS